MTLVPWLYISAVRPILTYGVLVWKALEVILDIKPISMQVLYKERLDILHSWIQSLGFNGHGGTQKAIKKLGRNLLLPAYILVTGY